MKLPDINELIDIVRQAGRQQLMPFFGQTSRRYKADKSIVTEADIATQDALKTALEDRWPGYAFLGEEMTAQQQQECMAGNDAGLWIVDPLDGTSNFAAGIPYFAISVALYSNGRIQLGVVYDPNRDEAFSAVLGGSACLNSSPLESAPGPESLSAAIGAIDFKRLPTALACQLVTQQPFSSQRSFGSVALDWCWLAAGRFHVYLHGRCNIWDYAAGQLIFQQAGGYSTTLKGEAVFQPAVMPRSVVAAMDERHFQEWTGFLGINLSA